MTEHRIAELEARLVAEESRSATLEAQVGELQSVVQKICTKVELEPPPPIVGVDWLRPKDVVFITGLSRSAVQKRMNSGRYRVGYRGAKRFIRADIPPSALRIRRPRAAERRHLTLSGRHRDRARDARSRTHGLIAVCTHKAN
jgi:hypothetical protein